MYSGVGSLLSFVAVPSDSTTCTVLVTCTRPYLILFILLLFAHHVHTAYRHNPTRLLGNVVQTRKNQGKKVRTAVLLFVLVQQSASL